MKKKMGEEEEIELEVPSASTHGVLGAVATSPPRTEGTSKKVEFICSIYFQLCSPGLSFLCPVSYFHTQKGNNTPGYRGIRASSYQDTFSSSRCEVNNM